MQAVRRSLPWGWLAGALVALVAVLAFVMTHVVAGVEEHGDEVAEVAAHGGPSGVLVVVGLAAALLIGGAIRHRGRLGVTLFVAAPLAVYLAGELAEGVLGAEGHLEADVLATVAAQLPAAIIALLLSRLVLRTVRRVACLLARRRAMAVLRRPARTLPVACVERPHLRIPIGTHLGRGPPLSASV